MLAVLVGAGAALIGVAAREPVAAAADDPRSESDAPQEPTVQLSLAESDDGEMEALEELVGNLQELVDQAKAVVEQDQEENEKAGHDRQTVDC
ncbi:hypothetical protein [Pseudonocardia adelaidensis]|uniref:hypothetical protein n=1 Tax=Pseudonocardia adelaidensis TaxID=648754 RepID=UPI0031ECF891